MSKVKTTKVELTDAQIYNLQMIEEIERNHENFKNLGNLIDSLFYRHVIETNCDLFFSSEEVLEIQEVANFFKNLKLKNE